MGRMSACGENMMAMKAYRLPFWAQPRSFLRAPGIHGTSLNDIAQAAGLSKGTLYYYYPTKEALVNDIAETHGARVTDLLLSWVETLSRDCPMDEALLLLMEALLEDEALRRLHVVLFTESCLDNPGLAALMEDKLKKWTVMLEVGTLKVQSDSARRLARSLLALFHDAHGRNAARGNFPG